MATYLGRIQLLAKLPTDWAANDAVLLLGEIGASNVGSMLPVLKIGDGVRPWSLLPNLVGAGGGGGGTAADPSAEVGLFAINGVASTFMRSDAAPALSQAIAPTWTGPHTFFITPGVPNASWTYAKIQNVTSGRVLGRVTSGSGVIEELSGAQATSLLDIFTSTAQGVVPASGGGAANFLRADGVFAVPPGTATSVVPANPSATVALTPKNGSALTFMRSDAAPALDQAIAPTWSALHTFALTPVVPDASWTYAKIQNVTSARLLGRLSAGAGVMEELSGTQLTPLLDIFTSTLKGLVPASGGGAANFLRADGVFAVPPGTAVSALPANRTVATTLTVQHGSAATFARSDSAPALDQGIAPTWTSQHIFTRGGTGYNTAISLQANAPAIAFLNTGASANNRLWDLFAGDTNVFVGRAVNDPSTVSANWLIVSRTGTVIDSIALNATNVSTSLNLNCGGNFYFTRSTDAHIIVGTRTAFSDLNDGYLRLNNYAQYAAGIVTPGVLRAGTYLQADIGIQKGNDLSRSIVWNTGVLSYGTAMLAGAVGGYHGLIIDDSAIRPTLMSNGSEAGIFNQNEAWLIRRTSPSQANISYNLTLTNGTTNYGMSAASFNVISSRTLKRETGRPSRVAEMLARLRPILYRLLQGDDSEQIGLIAEEVHEICPQMSDGKSVSYDRLAILLLADWQERHARGALIDQQTEG